MVFGLVLAGVIALIIFFGAWAVSADVGNKRSLAFGLAGVSPTAAGQDVAQDNAGAFGSNSLDGHETAGDTWWGQAFLRACPLH